MLPLGTTQQEAIVLLQNWDTAVANNPTYRQLSPEAQAYYKKLVTLRSEGKPLSEQQTTFLREANSNPRTAKVPFDNAVVHTIAGAVLLVSTVIATVLSITQTPANAFGKS